MKRGFVWCIPHSDFMDDSKCDLKENLKKKNS